MAKPKNFKDSIDSRKERQESEGYEQVSTNLPEDRFSGAKQVLTPDQMGVTKANISDPAGNKISDAQATAAKEIKSKIKIRPEVAVDELEGKQVGGVPLVGAVNAKSVAGVSNMSPADDMSKIPYSKGGYRPQSRYGKKRSEDLFELDNQIAEQIAPVVEDSLDLREAPEAKQGYNGRKQFKQTRGKKNFSFTNGNSHTLQKLPQQLLNETSIDFINTSKVVYTSGQMITGSSDSANVKIPTGGDYPTVRHDGSAVPVPMHKGNYALKSMEIDMQGGNITGIRFNEDYYEVHADPISRDQANMNIQVDTHNVAKALVRLQKELGRETTDKWSPLAYVVDEPYEVDMLHHDIEASTGAIMSTAYRSAVSSMGYQRNIAGKDGVNPQRNAIKMIYEGTYGIMADDAKDTITDTDFKHMLFNKVAYQDGAVTGLIAMFDSTGKYRTKADILGLQRSLGLHLSQCDNNLNPLHVKPNFLKALNKAHMFSTITGEYNPLLPIFSTKYIKLINPLSLNVFLHDWKNPALFTASDKKDVFRDQETGTYANYSYMYKDIRDNKYVTRIQHPVVDGLCRWLLKHEGAFVSVFGNDDQSSNTITIPCSFDFQAPSLFQFILCSASQDVLWERNIIFRDILFAGEQDQYIWDDLVGLDKLDPLYSTQLKINGYDQPLTLGKLSQDTVIRELWNDQMQLTVHDNNTTQYMMPWYFNEQQFGHTAGGQYTFNEGFFAEETAFNMSIPSIRDGVRHEYVDVIKSVSERDVRLALDRRVALPVYVTDSSETCFKKYTNYNAANILDSNVKLSSLRYDANSDGRIIAKYTALNTNHLSFNYAALYCTPKEIGFIDDYYFGYAVITNIASSKGNPVVTAGALASSTTLSGMVMYNGFSPMYLTSYRVDADSDASAAIDRSAALTQIFYNCFAAPDARTLDINYVDKTGIVPALSYNDGAASDIYAVYNLGSNNESTHVVDKTIRSISQRIWTTLQRFFLPINRFENIFAVNQNVDYDPLESAFYFGVCGTLASDYTQDVLERLDAYDQLGIDYTEDVFCKDSLIFQ